MIGEMTMIVVIALTIGGTACFVLGSFFGGKQDMKKYTQAPDEGAGWSAGSATRADDEKDKGRGESRGQEK